MKRCGSVGAGAVAFALLVLLLTGCESNGDAGVQEGVPAPSVTVRTLAGAELDPSAQPGKVVVLDFWATWCGPCRMTIPLFRALHEKYAGRGLLVVGVSDESPEQVAPFARENRMTYTVGIDPSGYAKRAYSVTALPTTVVIDKKGRVRLYEEGFDPSATESRLNRLVQELLAEK